MELEQAAPSFLSPDKRVHIHIGSTQSRQRWSFVGEKSLAWPLFLVHACGRMEIMMIAIALETPKKEPTSPPEMPKNHGHAHPWRRNANATIHKEPFQSGVKAGVLSKGDFSHRYLTLHGFGRIKSLIWHESRFESTVNGSRADLSINRDGHSKWIFSTR